MKVDISHTKIKDYIDKFDPNTAEVIAHLIVSGESFVNAFESREGEVLLESVSELIEREMRGMLNLIIEQKYEDKEELRRIRQHCVAIDRFYDLIRRWKKKVEEFETRINKID